MSKKIILANPRGFCAGVVRAIDIVEIALRQFGPPIYVRHAIVHNEHVIKELEEKGAIFVEDLNEIPKGCRVIFSAHGSPPDLKTKAKSLELKPIDAVCPLVTKVHLETKQFTRDGYTIIYIGHKGHQEAIGTTAQAPMHLVESVQDVENLNIQAEKLVYLTQTTLSIDDTKEVVDALKKKFSHIEDTPKGDICYATTNRQGAVKELAKQVNLILVIGSEQSSNSKRLVETSAHCNKRSYLIQHANDIKEDWLKEVNSVGITSGASTPDVLVNEVVEHLKELLNTNDVSYLDFAEETVKFSMPPELQVENE